MTKFEEGFQEGQHKGRLDMWTAFHKNCINFDSKEDKTTKDDVDDGAPDRCFIAHGADCTFTICPIALEISKVKEVKSLKNL